MNSIRAIHTAPSQSAKAASLRHVSDDRAGITRRRAGKSFSYRAPDGQIIRDKEVLARIRALAIPPAYTDVWICPFPDGHLQATGRDARGRKQYRYHVKWRQVRDETKYARLAHFALTLPRIRTKVREHLRLPGLPRNKVLAIVVRLLETTFIRVGNEEYARTNGSFGLTTMQDKHVHVDGARVHLRFRGKSRKSHSITVTDKRLAQLVKRCREVPGQQLFQYVDDAGHPHAVDSGDVNNYLRAVSGEAFTAKDFRTWAATLLAAQRLQHEPTTVKASKSNMIAAIESVSNSLGNTPAICRKSYIHPAVLNAFLDRSAYRQWRKAEASPARVAGLRIDERALVSFLGMEEKAAKAA